MLKLHLFGTPRVNLNNQPIDSFASDKVLALLCYLVVEGGEQRRDTLTTLFWGEMPEDKARGSLRSALYNLQKHLPDHITSTRKTVAFDFAKPHQVDVIAFADGVEPDDAYAPAFAQAVALYDGQFMDGVGFRDAESAETWLRLKRESYRLLAQRNLQRLTDAQIERGQWQSAAQTARQLISIEPWHESAHYQLMLCLARQGDTVAALQQYEQCTAMLDEELGVEPLPRTRALQQRILAARSATPPALPTDITPLVGRKQELNGLSGLLNKADCRLLTIVGIGGVGKTRLALAAAREQAAWYINGVAFVSLAGIEATDSAQPLSGAIAAALGLTLTGSQSAESQLIDHLKNHELLLVLDNFEHIRSVGVGLIDKLLQACPDLNMLVTSRERLELQQEWLFAVTGLPFPSLQEAQHATMLTYGATALFAQTAQRVNHTLEISAEITSVQQICQLVEGLPLGIELAAALTASQSPQQIADSLSQHLDAAVTHYHNIPPRHRSLRATFDYSWSLLSADLQTLLSKLSVFRGGFTPDAAQAVANATPTKLADLQARSLIRQQPHNRFDLHEVVKQYSAERFSSSPPLLVSPSPPLLHCQHYTNWLDTLSKTLNDPDHMRASQAAFDRDIDNVRAAWRYAIAQPLPAEITTMSASYIMYMESTGMYYEGVQQFGSAVEQLREQTSEAGRHALAQAAWGLGWSLERVGNLSESEQAFDLAVYNARVVEDSASLAIILRQYALLEMARGGLQKARTMLEESIMIADAEGLAKQYAGSITILAATLNRMGEYDKALEAINESIRLKADAGNALEMAISQHNKGDILMRLGRVDEAEQLYQQVFAFCDGVNETMGKIVSRKALGIIALERGDTVTARGHFDYIHEQSAPISPHITVLADVRLATVDEAEGKLEKAQSAYEKAIVFLQDSADFGTAASAQELLGGLLIKQGKLDDAELILQQAITVARDAELQSTYLTALLHLAQLNALRGEHDEAAEQLVFVAQHNAAEASHHARIVALRSQFSLNHPT